MCEDKKTWALDWSKPGVFDVTPAPASERHRDSLLAVKLRITAESKAFGVASNRQIWDGNWSRVFGLIGVGPHREKKVFAEEAGRVKSDTCRAGLFSLQLGVLRNQQRYFATSRFFIFFSFRLSTVCTSPYFCKSEVWRPAV